MLLSGARKLLYLRNLAPEAAEEPNLSAIGIWRIGSAGKKHRPLTGRRLTLAFNQPAGSPLQADRATGGPMNRPIFFVALLAFTLVLAVSTPAPAKENPLSLAQRELAAESRGDVAAALALYSDDAIVQYGGLCWTPCVGKAAIQKELERRVAAKNRWKIIGTYVSGNVAALQTELRIGFIEGSGVDRVVVWCIYEVKGDKIAVVTLVGQRTDPQTARFIEWFKAQPPER